MIYQKLPLSLRTRETSKFSMVAVITRGNISFGIPHTFSLSKNTRICLTSSLVEVSPSFFAYVHQLEYYPFHCPFTKVPCSWETVSDRCDVLILPFTTFFFFVVVTFLSFKSSDNINNLLKDFYLQGERFFFDESSRLF